jgi:hypothetical protein
MWREGITSFEGQAVRAKAVGVSATRECTVGAGQEGVKTGLRGLRDRRQRFKAKAVGVSATRECTVGARSENWTTGS